MSTLRDWGGGWRCDECCNGDRCDDPTHYERSKCPHCKGTGFALWNIYGKEREAKEQADRIAALEAEIAKMHEPLPCGHPKTMMLFDADTGAALYCECCDMRDQRNDLQADLARITSERNEALSLAHSRALVIERVTEDWNAAMSAVRVCRSALWTVCNLPGDYDLNADKHQVTLTTGRAFALADSLLAIDAARKEGA